MDHSPPRGAIPGATYNQRNNLGKKKFDAGKHGRGAEAAILGGGQLGVDAGGRAASPRDWHTQNQLNYSPSHHSPSTAARGQQYNLIAGRPSGMALGRNWSSINGGLADEEHTGHASGKKIIHQATVGAYNPIHGVFQADPHARPTPDSRLFAPKQGIPIQDGKPSPSFDINDPPRPPNVS